MLLACLAACQSTDIPCEFLALARAGYGAILVAAMKTRILLALSTSLLMGSISAVPSIGAPNDQPSSPAEAAAQISFHTLDNDVQQVSVDQIWRIRAATTRDEPAGATVIDYGYERVFVKDSLEDTVGLIRAQRDVRKFTLPSGAPIYIVRNKIIGIDRPIPSQHHQLSQAVIIAREGRQPVRESRESIGDALK
jgi:hypothetical protein